MAYARAMIVWGKSRVSVIGAALALCALAAAIGAAPAGAAPTWLPTTDLSAPGGDASFAGVAIDDGGDAVATWERFDGSNDIVEAATRLAGGTWSAPTPLSAPGEDGRSPQVAMAAGGEAVAVWRRNDGANLIVEAATHPLGGAWSASVKVSVPGQNASNQRVAIDARGDAVATWERSNGTNEIVEASSHAAGGGWTAPVPISAAGRDAENPRVAMSADGHAAIVFERYDGTRWRVEASTLTFGGAWSPAVVLSTVGEGGETPMVAMDATGDATVVWEGFDGMTPRVEAASLKVGGAWSAPATLSTPGAEAVAPRVAMSAAGDAVADWTEGAETTRIAAVTRPAAAAAWGPPTLISPTTGDAEDARIAMSAGGDAMALWRHEIGPDEIVEAARLAAGGGWSAPTMLSAPGKDAYEPAVAMDPGGDTVAAWSRSNGTDEILQAAVNDAAGPFQRGLTFPPGGVTGQRLALSVAPFDPFSALGATTWSFGDGTTATGTSVTHGYSSPGTYSVTVTSADAVGNTSSAVKTVTIAQALARAIGKARVKGKVAQLQLSCPTAGTCAGALTLSARFKPAARKGKGGKRPKARPARTVQIGNSAFTLASGQSATIGIQLSAKGLSLLAAKKGTLGVVLGGTGIEAGSVQLKAAKPKKKKHHHHRAHR
jgi:hypothetical protein